MSEPINYNERTDKVGLLHPQSSYIGSKINSLDLPRSLACHCWIHWTSWSLERRPVFIQSDPCQFCSWVSMTWKINEKIHRFCFNQNISSTIYDPVCSSVGRSSVIWSVGLSVGLFVIISLKDGDLRFYAPIEVLVWMLSTWLNFWCG